MTMVTKRITPLTVVPDLEASARHYDALGFQRIDTESPDCLGMRAGESGLILVTPRHLEVDFGPVSHVLAGRTLAYLHVTSVEAALDVLDGDAVRLALVTTRAGTVEALVERNGEYFILAETLEQDRAPAPAGL